MNKESTMRTAIVPAHALSAKDLRASHYVANPKKLAADAIRKWEVELGVQLRGHGGKRLREIVEKAIREGMAKR